MTDARDPRDDPDRSCSRSTSATSTTRSRIAAARRAVVRRGQGRARALRRGRPEAFDALARHSASGCSADLKLHDIPTTVERAARVLGRHGVELPELPRRRWRRRCCARASKACTKARATRGHRAPVALAVTVLTSDRERRRARRSACETARDAGCDGVVCSGARRRAIARVRRAAHDGAGHPPRRAATRTTRRASTRRARRDRRGRRLARDRPRGHRAPTIRQRPPQRSRAEVAAAVASTEHAGPDPTLRESGCRYCARCVSTASARPYVLGGRRHAAPAPLTPEQRQAALEKAAEARRQRGRGEGEAQDGLAEPRRALRRRATQRRHARRSSRS